MTRYAFLGDIDSRVDDAAGNPVASRRVRFYADAGKATEYTDLASDAAGTGAPLTVLTNAYGYAPTVYLPDGVDGSDTHPVYVGGVDQAGNPPPFVVRVYSHQAPGGGGGGVAGVASFNTRTGAVTLTKTDVTGTGLTAADVSADASGAAAAVLASSAQKAANLSDLGNAATARTNLGLGTAATHPTTDFDAAGTATSAVATHAAATDPHADRAYTDTKVAALVNSAPALLDTLGEIATQLQSDESAATALTTTVAGKQNVVVHGATAGTARPAGATLVHWVGSVAPTNAATNDEWTDTANKAIKRWNGSAFDTIGSGTSVSYPNSGGAATVVDRPSLSVNVKDYGAKGDAVSLMDGVTNATTTFTSAGSSFAAGDVGKTIIVYAQGVASADLVTTIAAVNSPTSITLAAAATGSATARPFTYGTDDSAAITSALAAAGTTNAEIYFPRGRYLDFTARNFDLSNNVKIRGNSTRQWLKDSLQPTPASEWVFAGTGSGSFISARGTVGFEMHGMSVRYVSKAFTGILLNLASLPPTRHTFTPRLSDCLFDMVNDVLTATACLDVRGIVVLDADNCTFGGATNLIQCVTGSDNWSNAITFRACVFSNAGTGGKIVLSGSGLTVHHWLFSGCTFEPQAFGSASTPMSINLAQGIKFDGCGFWDGNGYILQSTGTLQGVSFDGCYFQIFNGDQAFNVATVDGMSVEGCYFESTSGTANIFNATPTSVQHLNWRGNAVTAGINDNHATATNVLNDGVIGRVVVGVGGAATVTFSSIPQTFENLRIKVLARSDTAANNTALKVQFNGDTATNYDDQAIYGNALSASADEAIGQTSARLAKWISAANNTAGRFSTVAVEIPSYARTVANKIAISTAGLIMTSGSGGLAAQTLAATWRSNAAITSIVLFPAAGNFVQGTVVTLYGDN